MERSRKVEQGDTAKENLLCVTAVSGGFFPVPKGFQA